MYMYRVKQKGKCRVTTICESTQTAPNTVVDPCLILGGTCFLVLNNPHPNTTGIEVVHYYTQEFNPPKNGT